jgi:hypothetical protein
MSLRINKFLDFFHRSLFQELENTKFRKLNLFPFSDVGGNIPNQSGPLERANPNQGLSSDIV